MAPISPLAHILTSLDPTARRELPMPAATKAGSIEQAQATLYLCAIKLRSRVEVWQDKTTGFWNVNQFVAEGQQFRSWLESWETAFSVLLSNAMPSMRQEDVDRCRMLKANHLSCVVLASLLESSSNNRREGVNRDCVAIVGLATAMLAGQASQPSRSPRNAMTMAEPLLVVQSHCNSASLRDHAANMLAQYFSTQESRQPATSTSPTSSIAASSPRSVLSHTYSHSRTSSQTRYTG